MQALVAISKNKIKNLNFPIINFQIDPLTNEHVEGGYRGDCPNSGDPEYNCKSHEEGLQKSEDFNQYKNCK